ncbi:lysozyme [Methylobacterium sp. V23]|uniref:lysozyme n=1 Tax=Methylobacterium sp. V23 TaxID=2044878 RepID=UPI000CDB9B19|nr:lysozyme [Methylobacterium sp. V23]POR42577.1 glycoside hydrolase [Methylobacterium sp. V23]
MDLSPIGREALEKREGCRLEAYRDSVGVWTIACGVTTASGLIKVTPGLRITEAQADELNARAFARYAGYVRAAIGDKPIQQHQFDAFVSIVFNIGPGGFQGSTFLRRFMAGDPQGCADAILLWKKPAEIIPRRQAEADQFRIPYGKALPKARRTDLVPIAAPAVAKPVPAPLPDPLAPMTAGSSPKLTSQPALTGGLLRSGAQATGTATRGLLNGLFSGIHNALARKA